MDDELDDLDEVIGEFLAESYEGLDQLAIDLLTLEESPDDNEVISRLFRTLHTIKGTCGFLDFPKLEAVSHAGETLLSRMRDGSVRADSVITDALLALSDALREFLQEIETTGSEGDGDFPNLRERLLALAEGRREQDADGEGAPAPAKPKPTPPKKKAAAPPATSKPATASRGTADSAPAASPEAPSPSSDSDSGPASTEAPAPNKAEEEPPEPRAYCTFHLADYLFGVSVDRVQEVLHRADITPVPLSPHYIAGVISLRGKIVTAIDSRTLLELPELEDKGTAMHLVVNTSDSTLSLIIDRVGDVISPDEDSLEGLPRTTPAIVRKYVSAVSKLEGQLLLVLDTEQLTAG